ncbi:MAG: adenylosuccinate lyase [Maribacter sp.]|nr:adenylosuccinate lyase [Maribacter sp.]
MYDFVDKTEIYELLNYVDATRKKRKEVASMVLNNPDLLGPLLTIGFQNQHPISSRAFWILEYVAKENLAVLLPYLDEFTAKLGEIGLDASVRAAAKISECLLLAYFSKAKNTVQKVMTITHLVHMTSNCFDWLIGDQKVAVKAYSMTCLLLLGRKFDWIHPELTLVLTENYAHGSAAYQARARITLKKINKEYRQRLRC